MINIWFFLHSKESKKKTLSLYMEVHCDGVVCLRQAVKVAIAEKGESHLAEGQCAKHDYHKEINARLERLSLKVQQIRELMDEGQLPTGEDLRAFLQPLRTEKLARGGPMTVVHCYKS
jgi:hypothetical protein